MTNSLLTIAQMHDPWIIALAFAMLALGGFMGVAMTLRSRTVDKAIRLHWMALSTIVKSGSIWAAQFILLVSFFGGLGWAFQPMQSFLAWAVLIVGITGTQFFYTRNTNRKQLCAARVTASIVYTVASYINISSFAWFDLPLTEVAFGGIAMATVLGAIAWRVGGIISEPSRATIVRLGVVLAACYMGVYFWFLTAIPHGFLETMPSGSGSSLATITPVFAIAAILMAVGGSTYAMDAKAHRASIDKYQRLAFHDSLTGLPNRLSMQVMIDDHIQRHRDRDPGMAVAVLDLDRFKDVNDVHGHAAGDALLKGLAQHLTAALSNQEKLIRLGGDEFVGVKFDAANREDAEAFGERLCSLVHSFDAWMTGDIKVGASIGVCIYPEDGDVTEMLLSRADLAMYRAKTTGRNQVCMFDNEMDEQTRRKSAMSMDLGFAIENNELALMYQPQVDSLTGEPVGFEVLLRWNHPELGRVPPTEFIPLAEQTGQILDIGEWVLREACREAASWARPYRIAVNVAAGQLNRWSLTDIVADVLSDTGLAPTRLELEITESGIINDQENAYRILSKLKAMGVAVAMDDFGTGYSSLSTLQSFPFDKIKIDRAFISDVNTNPHSAAIVKATITLAEEMDIKVLAEGVETEDQLAFLRRSQCPEIQGFFFSKPLSTEDVRARYGLMDSTETLFAREVAAEKRSKKGAA